MLGDCVFFRKTFVAALGSGLGSEWLIYFSSRHRSEQRISPLKRSRAVERQCRPVRQAEPMQIENGGLTERLDSIEINQPNEERI